MGTHGQETTKNDRHFLFSCCLHPFPCYWSYYECYSSIIREGNEGEERKIDSHYVNGREKRSELFLSFSFLLAFPVRRVTQFDDVYYAPFNQATTTIKGERQVIREDRKMSSFPSSSVVASHSVSKDR